MEECQKVIDTMNKKKHFINLLRVLAAICITNSHFANVWPISAIASGGMLGDVLFFAISGYCLYHSDFKFSDFGKWYIKRIKRIYITVILITLLTCSFAGFPDTTLGWVRTFIYPTQYHFVASIMVLYIIYYIWMNVLKRFQIPVWKSGIILSIIILAAYIMMFDKSWYHIDVVEEHFIRFLFFASMLLGAHFKEREERESISENSWKLGIICIISVMIYFVVRIAVPRFELFTVQFLTWIAILSALYWIFRWAESMEIFLLKLPAKASRCLAFVAGITLQIYLVQYPIIERFETLLFPLNLFVIAVMIIVAAIIVFELDRFIQKGIGAVFHHSNRK